MIKIAMMVALLWTGAAMASSGGSQNAGDAAPAMGDAYAPDTSKITISNPPAPSSYCRTVPVPVFAAPGMIGGIICFYRFDGDVLAPMCASDPEMAAIMRVARCGK